MSQKIKEYDETFFNEKMLLVAVLVEPTADRRTLKKVDFANDEFVVTIEKPLPSDDVESMEGPIMHVFLVELDKTIGNHPVVLNVTY